MVLEQGIRFEIAVDVERGMDFRPAVEPKATAKSGVVGERFTRALLRNAEIPAGKLMAETKGWRCCSGTR